MSREVLKKKLVQYEWRLSQPRALEEVTRSGCAAGRKQDQQFH